MIVLRIRPPRRRTRSWNHRLSAEVGWFSDVPGTEFADNGIEELILDTVQFFSRDKYELIPLIDVPPVVLSETMRDIDIASLESIMHEASFEVSHSIVETRIAAAREMLSILSIENVSFQAEYAQITGSMGTYLVHMGTGAVYKHGMMKLNQGMMKLDVPSANRGTINRVFLPFEDCGSQTVGILSKIILFANDKKIKDINLIEQIEADKLLSPINSV